MDFVFFGSILDHSRKQAVQECSPDGEELPNEVEELTSVEV